MKIENSERTGNYQPKDVFPRGSALTVKIPREEALNWRNGSLARRIYSAGKGEWGPGRAGHERAVQDW
jgi:hypothetical protein